MSGTSTLLGQNHDTPVENPEKTKEEEDLHERNTKKAKGGDQNFTAGSTLPTDYNDIVGQPAAMMDHGRSYRDMVIGVTENKDNETEEEEEEGAETEGEGEDMKVVENAIGGYACPEFVFSKTEEKRIYRPWRRGVIVKLLGRRIGYKALETRLKQMWVRKGVISIIDLSNDYYLVAFTHEDDQYATLMDGPWFIYDHYLTVKEWSPNFHPASDTIKEVAVWVRISGLPIEYYDAKILNYIGNRVGKTVKVDKNTLTHERGKYARLCVQVDLTKPLLAMFTIKGRKYNVEYEGLHMLCLTCGKFGHYKEGCPNREKPHPDHHENGDGNGRQTQEVGGTMDGPWRVVQKLKRGRKPGIPRPHVAAEGKNGEGPMKFNAEPVNINADPKFFGSRFVSLSEEVPVINEEDMERGEQREKPANHEEIIREKNVSKHNGPVQVSKAKRANSGMSSKKGGINQERITKDVVLLTRGGGSGKGNVVPSIKKGVEVISKTLGTKVIESSRMGGPFQQNTRGTQSGGQKGVHNPNLARPPNILATPSGNFSRHAKHMGDMDIDNELFLDADDQGSVGSVESEMEFVAETPRP